MAELTFSHISASLGGKSLLKDVSLKFTSGNLTALVGPNGAGKTSLLKVALGQLPLSSGEIILNDRPLTAYSNADRARQLAYLPQVRPLAWPLLVRDTVALGRFAYGGATGRLSPEDKAAVTQALTDCGISHLAARPTDQLSGGELARVHCARAFAAGSPLLLADEPVNALDPKHQLRIMSLIRDYVDNGGGALVVMHDIALAARFADRMVWMRDGTLQANGTVQETLTGGQMKKVFDVSAEVNFDDDHPVVMLREDPTTPLAGEPPTRP